MHHDVNQMVPASSLSALPIACDLAGPHAADIRRYVESVLGWQIVDAATASLMPPAIRLLDASTQGVSLAVPAVLLVAPTDDPPGVAEQCVATRPIAVLRWPDARAELHDVVAGALHGTSAQAPSPTAVVRVGGSSGGVGVTTVALALAGLAGWRSKPTVAVVGTDDLVTHARRIDAAACASPDLYARATPLVGCPTARVVVVDEARDVVAPTSGDMALLVVDHGVSDDVDVLVIRPDRAGMCALDRSAAGSVIVTGNGPVPTRRVLEAAAGRQLQVLDWSARVQRAGFHRRVPAGLPGAWLRQLDLVAGGA